MRAYWFFGDRLRDGRAVPADGEWLEHDGEAEICKRGLHASIHPFDALNYAPAANLALVECEDIIIEEADKFVCRRRKILKRVDATDLLREFARNRALSVAHLWDCPSIVREYLETGREDIREVAKAAARAAAMAIFPAKAAKAVKAAEAADAATWAADAATWAAMGGAAAARGAEAAAEAAAAAAMVAGGVKSRARIALRAAARERLSTMVEEVFNRI